MRVIFVRHGDPDYKNDCLTPLGQLQAKAAAQRLKDEGIEKGYSSTNGRAYETAEYTARLYGCDVIPCDFMREIGWGAIEGEVLEVSSPWKTARMMPAAGLSLLDPNFAEKEPFKRNKVVKNALKVNEGLDRWFEELGYKREGEYYRVINPSDRTVAMFCHGGSSSAAFAHVFNLPLPFTFGVLKGGHASILFEIILDGAEGELVTPLLSTVNDCKHTKGIVIEREHEF